MFYRLDTLKGIKGERILPHTNGRLPDIVLAFDRLCLSGSYSHPLTVIAYPTRDDRYRVVNTRPCYINWSELEAADLYDRKHGSYNADIILKSGNVEIMFSSPCPKRTLKKISEKICGGKAKPVAYVPKSYDITTPWGKLLDDFYGCRLTDIWTDNITLLSCELNDGALNIQVQKNLDITDITFIEDSEKIEGVYISEKGKLLAAIDPEDYPNSKQLYNALAANVAADHAESGETVSAPIRTEPTFYELSDQLKQMKGKRFRRINILDKALYVCGILLIGYLVNLVKYSIIDKHGASIPILVFLGIIFVGSLVGEGLIQLFEHNTVAVTDDDGIYYLSKKTNSDSRFGLIHVKWTDIKEIYAFAEFKRTINRISLRSNGFRMGLLIESDDSSKEYDGQVMNVNLISLIANIKFHRRDIKVSVDGTTVFILILVGVIIGLAA